ncbi:carboxypeptidase-like regulatory domain-containing protein [Mucilaginibacter sp. ZT4R22]|uniref:Carboxypeptidase-like regulatory domain-containing protein n=1 Tax=Mucilaginibacter pankratovii TaxID=2772110 RepID=A0ABR7WVQ4_9SPHI|nr:carboxypeptidase-like regulatory domain-containing protein [Mucilaginibacter pankratovii]MBD1366375.1 carboxypeptidase-like regulatory domain-containing protein [Mucilaginibacter pankratovii]
MPQLLPRLFAFLMVSCLFTCSAFAQRPLTKSRQSSYYTYIYKLNSADLLGFYKAPEKPFDDKLFRNPVDSFVTDKYWENTLPPGNYVKVHAEQNKLQYAVIENHSAFLKLFTGKYEHRFALTDKKGSYISNAIVLLNGKKVAYDANSGTWHFKGTKAAGILQVDHSGVSNFYQISPANYYGYEKGWWAKLWASVKNIFKRNNKYHYKPKPYTGFMVFNKPIYKPGDTVKFKAFILNTKNKKPIPNKKLLVKLVTGDGSKKMGTVSSYRDGGFEYSFVLADSLDLTLDDDYTVLLTDPSKEKKKKNPENEEDDDNDEGENSKDVIYSGRFQFEEYELKSIHFSMRTDKKEHWPGSQQVVYLKATDENELPVADGRVVLNLITTNVNQPKANHQFVADTLWKHQFALDAVGETKITIPDSIFPKANVNYDIDAQFLNSNNEQQNSEVEGKFKYDRFHVITDVVNDSLKISRQEYGKPAAATGIVSALNADGDTLTKQKILLPGFVLINPSASEYNIETDSTDTDLEMKDFKGNISLSSERTADSVFVSVANPRKLHFFYSVFTGGRLTDHGQADKLFYKKALSQNAPLTFVINYIWAGVVKTETLYSTYRPDILNIAVKQPVSVYPGQKVQTDVVVTDAAGKPVANTDVTAWALTKKFSYNGPNVPYIGKPKRYKAGVKEFKLGEPNLQGHSKLNWQRWGREIGLDSIAYYQFTHPQNNIYRIEEPGIDTVTQVAPFVVKNGDIVPVHILYIDHLPVYFSQAQQLQPYSFKVSPGYHSLMLRTAAQIIEVDSVKMERNKKLIISINANTYPAQKLPDTLSFYEANNINKYLVSVVNNFDGRRAMIAQTDKIFFLNPAATAGSAVLTGPLTPNYTVYDHQGDKPQAFLAEPNYTYLFEPGLIRQKSITANYPFARWLGNINGTTNYKQYVLTNNAADSLWQDYLDKRANTTQLFTNLPVKGHNTGRLKIDRLPVENEKMALIKNVILYRYDNPDYISVYPGNTTDLAELAQGKYRIFFLLQGDRYDIKDSIEVKTHGINFYRFGISPRHARDSVSIKIGQIINSRKSERYRNADDQIENDALKLKEAFNQKYFSTGEFSQTLSGKIIGSDDKQPLIGVAVKIKGTTVGTQTNTNGEFRLQVPPQGKIIVSYIGYFTQEVDYTPGTTITLKLTPQKNQLQEVVVVGYGSVKRKDLTGSVSTMTFDQLLEGRAAGVTIIEGTPGGGINIRIRGASSIGANKPLYVVDGEIVADLKGLNPGMIGEISVLKDGAATGIYGVRGANGVIIISTKPKANAAPSPAEAPRGGEQTLRKNFSDYAYWQPKLVTDENGKASFTSVFPDDITNWRTFVVGINGKRQSGFIEKQIKSFKPLSANFIAPQFAVEGDEMSLIGKMMNYNSTPVNVTRTFSYNGKVLAQGDLQVSNAKIDTLNIVASATDSLAFEYSIKRDNGYFDGEQRKIPVVKQGVLETKGIFEALDRDTTISLKFNPALGPVTFRAEASALPALAEEARRLREYKYLCNEQLTSKLKGLLAEKRIKTFLGEPFKYEKNILAVIKKLQENRKPSGTWGWWADTNEELWISLHAVEALTDAQSMGYSVQLDKQKLTAYLVYQLESYRGEEKLACLQLLHQLSAKVDYIKYFAVIEKEYKLQKDVPGYNRMRLMLLKQQAGIPVKIDSLINAARKTMFDNIYWGEENYRFFDNSIQTSVIAYRIIKAAGKHPELLAKIRGYFLEQRKLGEWRNTYESALILETILPDLLEKDKQLKPSALTIKGTATETITTFPYTAILKDNAISISKTGSLPVYITGYQQFWNGKPEKVSKDFTVDTWFEKKGDKLTRLKGGEAVQLKAEVTVRGDADFVMIEIPIPAGCSYESKDQQWGNNEVHREFFKEKVSIFCRKLKQGTYTFSVNLMPRYSGKYNLNPAKAEQMYFPVFYGRESLKKVVIGN